MRSNSLFIGFALGAGFMYLLDPERGRARRALLRDKAFSVAHRTADAVDGKSRHVVNRTRGLVADLQAWRERGPSRHHGGQAAGDVEES